ncbi:hypothetical protein [Streptomyces sp. SP2-10]|nr:hypothetical protein [Streptomyces sp. SP2-10]
MSGSVAGATSQTFRRQADGSSYCPASMPEYDYELRYIEQM